MISIVIVEDEKLIREGLVETFDWQKFNCHVIGTAANGEEGEKLILQERPDIVITDIKMPKKSGLEMLKTVNETFSTNYIILSGYDEFEYAKEAISVGARGYLLKPIFDEELEELIEKISNEILEKRQTHAPKIIKYDESVKNALSDKYVQNAFAIIKAQYMNELTLKKAADELLISESYLGKLLKRKTNHTFLDLLTLYRLKRAIYYLEKSSLKVYEIAFEIGYTDAKYFSKIFTKIIGVNPSEYRNGYRLKKNTVMDIFDIFEQVEDTQ